MREMRPEIPSCLNSIKSLGLTIGCISNTQSTTQVPHTLTRYGIADYFAQSASPIANLILLSSLRARLANCPTRFVSMSVIRSTAMC